VLLDFPRLPLGAATERRRVGDDDVVLVAAFDFASHELSRVFDDPADRMLVKFGEFGIATSPFDDAWRSVDMGHADASTGQRQSGATGVSEQVQGFAVAQVEWRVEDPVPVDGLFGEDADLPGRCGAEFKANVGLTKVDLPRVGGRA